MKRLLLPLLAALALPTAVNAENHKDLTFETNLGEKIMVKESASQVQRITKKGIISEIYKSIENRQKLYEECVPNLGKRYCKKSWRPEKVKIEYPKLASDYELKESEELIAVKIFFVPIFEDLNGMKSRMNRAVANCVNPRITDISNKLSGDFIGMRLKNSKGQILGDNIPSEKYSNLSIDQVKKALCEKYAKF